MFGDVYNYTNLNFYLDYYAICSLNPPSTDKNRVFFNLIHLFFLVLARQDKSFDPIKGLVLCVQAVDKRWGRTTKSIRSTICLTLVLNNNSIVIDIFISCNLVIVRL